MITKNEISTLNLSPTKKDFVQIWGELLDVAGKLSERWDPTSTNESDPGIVILKALTGIADRLNYNIDKNILEAFMPTAAQEESMRKLCEMMGYNMKYLHSAVTNVTIRYSNPNPSDEEAEAIAIGLPIPKFTTVTSADNSISYFTTNPVDILISKTTPEVTVECIEGQIVKCESLNDNNVITYNQLTDHNRYYLPEVQVAENGIFIYNVASDTFNNLIDGKAWKRVDNLNTQSRLSYVFKFGYDSYEGRPYIEFPEDASELIGEGLFIYYTRTSGVNGNISPRTLTQLEIPNTEIWKNVATESFIVENTLAANTGSDTETIDQAYNNFKKTIGTFETLVTCRDYMNKIYTMVSSENRPYVSNILVTDIRNDINRAITICSCDDSGICYREKPLVDRIPSSYYKPIFNINQWHIGSVESPIVINEDNKNVYIKENKQNKFGLNSPGLVTAGPEGTWVITQGDKSFTTTLSTLETSESLIDHFDLVFYPFKTYNQITSNVKDIEALYDGSFKYSETHLDVIKARLAENKTIAHNITKPKIGDILSINNYLRLNTFIATTQKITVEEGTFIIDKIKIALANAFNMHELDFGEEIPFERILSVIEAADPRIKVASLNEPTLYTTFSVLKGYKRNIPQTVEYAVASQWLLDEEAKKINKLYEDNIPVELNSANFYLRKTSENNDGYYIYTKIDGIDKYLCASQTDSSRDQDAFISFEDFNPETVSKNENSDLNKSFVWTYETYADGKKGTWTTTFEHANNSNLNKKYFLGAYGSNTIVSISRAERLGIDNDITDANSNTEAGDLVYPKNTAEYPVNLCLVSDLPEYELIDEEDISNFLSKIKTDPDNVAGPYKLFINQTSLDADKAKIFYLLPKVTEDKKYIYTTAKPSEPETILENHFLFNTDEAKQVYNKLVLRNVLAGRVPLFNYNNTFTTDFTESVYLVNEPIEPSLIKPEIMKKLRVSEKKPFIKLAPIFDEDLETDVVYTAQKIIGNVNYYTRTYAPYDTLIEGTKELPIDRLTTSCVIKGDENKRTVSDIELAEGETIKFRAPNFVTTTTYPAYINYHLALKNGVEIASREAKGFSLKEILDRDLGKYEDALDKKSYITNWEKAFNYFKTDPNAVGKGLVKTRNLTLGVSAFVPADSNEVEEDDGSIILDTDKIVISIPATAQADTEEGVDSLLRKSGCLKALNHFPMQIDAESGKAFGGIKASLSWDTGSEDYKNKKDEIEASDQLNKLSNFYISMPGNNTPFITNIADIETLKTTINDQIIALKNKKWDDGTYILPTICPWKLTLSFEYIPLVVNSLSVWNEFIKTYCKRSNAPAAQFSSLPTENFEIIEENTGNGNIFYRLYTGHAYAKGKYINSEGAKFLPFNINSFSLLPLAESLPNIYVLTDLGQDEIPKSIKNGTEYQLTEGEFLYINYTPSSASENSTSTTVEPVNRVYSAGDIIRPSGFEMGLIDSEVKAGQGASWVKQGKFDTNEGNRIVNLHSLGSNEQIEIRDFAEVILSKDTLKDSSIMYVYKNFDCPELEGTTEYYDNTADIYRRVKQYTLKEGEYIFYTDRNKADTAYFTNGTLVTLRGVTIPRSEVIDIGTILDSGLQEVPWSLVNLSGSREIKFTEYQYVTLGAGDKLKSLTLTDDVENIELSKEWKPCKGEIAYYASTDKNNETTIKLPAVRTTDPKDGLMTSGNGWEVCSMLELNVSPNNVQTLRNTSNLSTELEYLKTSSGGALPKSETLKPIGKNPLSFKTNLVCQAVGNIADKNTLNPTSAKAVGLGGFTIKTFAKTEPLIVTTEHGKAAPYIVPLVMDPEFEDAKNRSTYINAIIDLIHNLKTAVNSLKDVEVKQPLFKDTIEDSISPNSRNLLLTLNSYLTESRENNINNTLLLVKELNSLFVTELSAFLNHLKYLIKADEEGSNSPLSGAEITVETIEDLYNDLNNLQKLLEEMICELGHDISVWDGDPVDDREYNDIWSRVSLDRIKEGVEGARTDKALKLPVLLVDNTYGVASFYVNYTSTEAQMSTWLEVPAEIDETNISLINANNQWNFDAPAVADRKWKSGQTNKLLLNKGLNCIKINKSCELFIKTSRSSQGEFFFDALRLVNTKTLHTNGGNEQKTQGLNLSQLDYLYTGSEEALTNAPKIILTENQLLAAIRKIDIDREFYYNAPVEKSLAIEFNETRTTYDTLMNPNIYYDLNNVNNTFVISKLDIDYLDAGIQIARSSRLN